MHLARNLTPNRRIRRRKPRIAVKIGMNFSNDHLIRAKRTFLIQLRTADQERLGGPIARRERQRIIEIGNGIAPVEASLSIARHDDIAPPRQHPPNRFMRLAPHDNRRAHRRAFEECEVFGQPPGQLVITADHAIAGASDDQRQRRHAKSEADGKRKPILPDRAPSARMPRERASLKDARANSEITSNRHSRDCWSPLNAPLPSAFSSALKPALSSLDVSRNPCVPISRYSVTREIPRSVAASLSRCRCRSSATSMARFSAASRAWARLIVCCSLKFARSRSTADISLFSAITIARRTRLISSRTFPGQW